MTIDEEQYHAMCDRLWRIVAPDALGTPCDVLLARQNEQLKDEIRAMVLVKAESAAKDALIGKLREALKGWMDEYHRSSQEVQETGHSEITPTAGMVVAGHEALAATPETASAELAALRADKARLDWLDGRDRVMWSSLEKDPMDMRILPLRESLDGNGAQNKESLADDIARGAAMEPRCEDFGEAGGTKGGK